MSEDDRITESVRQHGWHAIAVQETQTVPPFLYTIGLCDTLNHPEIVVFGLPRATAYNLVSDMVVQICSGRRYGAGEMDRTLIEGYTVALRPVHATQRLLRLGFATAYYRRARKSDLLSALQLLWPDVEGRLPFEARCDPEVVRLQPLLEYAVPDDEQRAVIERSGSEPN